MHRHGLLDPAVTLLILAAGCGGDGASTGNGTIHLWNYIVTPQRIDCGFEPANPPINIGSPDSVSLQVTIVNTTAAEVTLHTGGSQGVVIRATEPADVLSRPLTYESLPFRPTGIAVGARNGSVAYTFMMPTDGICRSKPVGYEGEMDIDVNLLLLAGPGIYATSPQTIRVHWYPT